MAQNAYEEAGYRNRADYLRGLADEYGADLCHVVALAEILGPSEDFYWLVVALQDDMECEGWD